MAKHILYCLNNKIRFTCLLDGTYLSFIPDHELYALFGNAVENAVTAVSGLEEEKKVISITSIVKGGFMNICITNYFDGSIMMRDGLPMSENDGHGFGVRSMRMIVEKYGGRISVTVKEDLLLPQAPETDADFVSLKAVFGKTVDKEYSTCNNIAVIGNDGGNII